MRISEDKINEVAQANDIIEVVSSYTKVKHSGKSYIALCPFHPDKNPSMSVSQEKQVYHCFSCGAGGNIFKFIQDIEKISFIDAVQKLAQRAGIELDIRDSSPDMSNEISRLLEINNTAARYFYETLRDFDGPERDFIFTYLNNRGLKDYTVKKFGIGYAPKSWDSLLHHFKENTEFSETDIEKVGLIIKSEKDGNYYDRFRGRLMFPIFNDAGKVVAFGGRKLFDDDKAAKYINSPETRIYDKSRILYGLNFAKESIRASDKVLLVEGYMDVIALSQADFSNCVASSGTSLTDEQVKLISRYSKNVSILFDGDFAGIKAAKRGIEKILQGGLNLRVTVFPENEDPDSFIKNKGKEEFENLLNSGQDFIEFITTLYAKDNKLETVEDKTSFIKEIIYYIGFIPDNIKRSFYIKQISSDYGLYESDLMDELKKVMNQISTQQTAGTFVNQQPFNLSTRRKKQDISSLEMELIELFIFGGNEVVEYIENHLEMSFIQSQTILNITEIFLDEYINDGKIDVSKILNKLDDENMIKIISAASTIKYNVSESGIKDKNSILNIQSSKSKNYMRTVKDLMKNLKLKKLHREAEDILREGSRLDEYMNIKKEILQLSKQ